MPKKTEVLDFLYVDAVRIRSIISQLEKVGVLDSRIEIDAIEAAKRSSVRGSIGNEEILYAAAEKDDERTTTDSTELRYDVQHTLPISLLDLLKEKRLVHANIDAASIGQFVSCEGVLAIVDTSFHNRLYTYDNTRRIALKRSEQNSKKLGQKWSRDNALIQLDMLTSLPPQVHAIVETSAQSIWCSLRPSGLTTPPGEINMKHGVVLEGIWTLLGIKDANPAIDQQELLSRVHALKKHYEDQMNLAEIIDTLRELHTSMGRPPTSYGITPMLIYRHIMS